MAEISPFRAVRYGAEIALDEVVAPPYDVLSAAQAAELRARSPYNAVHVDLPVPPGEPPVAAAYSLAARTLRHWRQDGVLVRDESPGIVLIDQTYPGPDGRECTRHGFVARLRLTDFAERVVLPHELTHAGPKVDRLNLYRATHADVSQIFLLYPDDDGSVADLIDAAATSVPEDGWREARDRDGNLHRTAGVMGDAARRVTEALRGRRLYIADGHHRYETALAYRDERRAAGDHSADTLMVYLCSLSDPGLTVFPTQRLVRGIPPLSQKTLAERLAPYFETVGEPSVGSEACAAQLDALPDRPDPTRTFVLCLPREETCLTVRAREPQASERLAAAGFSPVTAGLSVTLLHELLLGAAIGLARDQTEDHVDYASTIPDAVDALRSGAYELGAFLNATPVGQVRAVADQGEVMPQKSTYFYPKLLTGLVFDELGA